MASKGDINKTEIQPDLPERWVTIPFKEGLVKTGSFTKLKSKEYLDEGVYPVIDQGEKFISGFVNEQELIYKGDLPIVIFGDHTRIVKYIDFEFAAGADGTKILKCFKALDERFFFYYLKALMIPSFGYSRHFKVFEFLDLPIAPLPEQKRIVAKLDALFGHLDAVKTKLDRIPELLKNFRQQVLTQAVTGELKGSTYDLKPLGDFDIKVQTGPFGSALHKHEYIDGGIPVINPSHIKNGEIQPNQEVSISLEKLKELERWKLEDGDVIIGRRGEMGRAARYVHGQTMICGTGSLVFKKSTDLNPDFLSIYLRSPFTINYLETNSVGSTMINLNQKIIKSLPFPNVSQAEQTEIVGHVERLFSISERIESQYNSLKTKIDQLPQAILNKAFKGELVAQDASDEPAAVLLERIKSAAEKIEYKVKKNRVKLAAEPRGNYKTN